MTQSELRIYINTAAAEAMKDLRRMRNEIAALEASAKSMRAAARGSGAGTFFSAADIAAAKKMNDAINGVAASNKRAASSTSATSSATNRAAISAQNLARANDLASIAMQKLSAAEAVANTKMQEGTASATQMSAAYGRVASAAGAASAAQIKLAAAQSAVGATGKAAAATTMATELLRTQKGFVGLQREMGVAAARGDEFGHRTKTSLFDTLAAINDNESAMRRWGSQIQWTGRQMVSNLTVPIAMVAGMGGKVWFDQAQAMVGVEKVYGDISNAAGANEKELDALGKKFTELSNIFGINREEVIGVATEWAAAGASGIELARATNLTMQAMVLGNLSAEESTKALIATQAQYGFSVKEMSKVLAQFNFVENETGVTMGGLIQAFSRTAGVAREAGMDTAHLASMIAAMTPAAGSASEAGNGLKTIMTRLMRQTKDTTGTLELMNINVKEFASLPMDQKLMEVAKGFENLDDAQKGAAAGILAGGWQVNRMSVAMRELTNETGYYHKALRGLNDDNKVQQVMVRELTKQLTSDPKKLQQAWQRLRNSMAEIFVPIVPYVLYFMNSIAELAQKFNELPVPIQKLAVAIAMFLAALGPIIIMLGVFALVASSVKTPLMIIGTVLGFLVKGPFVALGKALTSGTGILGTFGAAAMKMGAILRAVFLGQLVTAVGAASAFVTGRVAAMAAAVSARFAAMTAAVAAHAGANITLTVGQWVKVLAVDAAGWVTRRAMLVANLAANWAAILGYWASVRAGTVANTAANLIVIARYWLARTTLMLLSLNSMFFGLLVHWAKLRAADVANTVANLAVLARYNVARVLMFLRSFNLVSAGLLVHWAKLKMIELGGWISSHAITAAGLLAKLFTWTKSLDMITVRQLIFWAKTNLMAKGGMMAMLRTVGTMMLRVLAVFVGPWGLAIAAVLGIIYVFRDQIKGAIDGVVNYFRNLPPEMAAALQPINNLWQKIVGGAQAAFNALPGFIQRPLVAVVKFVKAAAMKIYELFSYINPFARHSPSLVENVNNGMDAVAGRFGLAAKQVGGSVGQMYKQIKALKDAAGGLDAINSDAKRQEDIGKIQQGGGPNAGAQVAAYNAVSGTLGGLKGNLDSVSAAVDGQQRKVDSLSAAMKAADAAIDGMGEGLDKLKERAEAVGAQLDAAKERVEYFKGATISGMGAAEDAAFSNEMAQKKLQLQMKKLGDAATEGTDKARDEYAKLQGDIETMSGKRMELQFAGAGSDVLGGYDSMINGLKGQQLDIGSGVGASGPGAEVDALQKQLDELQRQAEIMDLEKALKFDPLTRQIEKATSTAYEIPFDSIMSGLSSSGAQVDSLARAYDRANAAVDSQQSAIDSAQAARDQLGKTYDAESEALENLKTVYSGIETAIRDGEQALNDMVSSADTAIQRIEELERKREEATSKAKGATGGSGSGGGAGGSGALSPNMQSLMNAEGAEPFPEVGGGLAIGRDDAFGLDQSQAIEDFDLLSENGLEGMFGDISMLGPFKDAWQKVKDWWSGIVLPLGDPVKSVGDDVGSIIQGAFGAEATGPLSTFMDILGKVGGFFVNLWNIVKGFGELLWGSIFPAIKEMGENIMANLGPALERVGGVFVENWPKIQSFAKMLWEVIKVVGIIAGVIAGVLVGAIILTISVFTNIFANVIGPLIDFIGRMVEAIVNVVMGVVGVITGLYNIIVGLFTGDWSRVWEGIKQLGTGIWSIIKGIWDAIVAVFKGAWDLIWGIVKGFVEGIIDFFTTLWDVLVGHSIVPDMINAIIDWFASLPGKVFEFVSNLVRGVIDFFLGLHAKAIELVGNLINGIVGFFMELPGRIWNTLVDLKNKVIGFFSGAKDWLFDAGKNIINGLLDGAGELLSKLGNFFAEKIPEGIIRDGFKKALGIESPAREMMGPGADVVRGIMAGAESQMPALDSLMSDVAGVVAATELVAPTVQAAGAALPAAAPVVAGPALPATDAAPAPVGITPEQSAAALASFTAFDIAYDALVLAHTTGIIAQYTAMWANLASQQSTSNAAQMAAQTAFALAFATSVTSMVATVIAQFTLMATQVTTLLTGNTSAWMTLILAFINNFLAQWSAFLNNLINAMNQGTTTITNLWQSMANNLGAILNNSIRPVFDAFLPMLQNLEGWFASTVQNIGSIWSQVQPKTAEPARFVINEVYNKGLRGAWNSFNEFLGLPELPAHVAAFRDGGAVNGPGTGTSDSIPARLSRGEHVITAREVQNAGGHQAIMQYRSVWNSGSSTSIGNRPDPRVEAAYALAEGGPVGPMPPMKGSEHGLNINSVRAGRAVSMKFPQVQTIGGYRASDPYPDHPSGNALDIMVGSFALGDAIHAWLWANNSKLFMASDIWKQTYYTSPTNGSLMGDRGDPTQNHMDHVHALFINSPKAAGMPIGGFPVGAPAVFEGAGSGGMSVDWGAVVGMTFDSAFDDIRANAPKIDGGIGQWIPKSIEKALKAKEFLATKLQEMTQYAGDIDDSAGAVERWRPMMKAALIRQGLAHWANDPAILDRFMRQIHHESRGVPNVTQGIQDINSGGNEAEGLAQIAKSTWVGARDPSLPDDWHDPWSNLNAMARYVRERYGPQGYLSIGNGIGYDSGGVLPATPGGFGTFYNHTGGPEAVLTDPQWDAVYRAAMATTEAEEVARGFRNAVLSAEYGRATDTAAKQVTREFGPKVDELALEYFDSAKLIADVAAEQGETWRDQFATTMEGVQKFFGTVSELYTIGKDIYTKLEEDGVIKEIEEATKEEVAALQDIANKVQAGAEVNEAMLQQVGANLSSMANSTIAILAQQPFETYAPIFDKMAELADMLPKAGRSYVPWAGLETDMTVGKSIELGINTVGNGVKGLYNIAQSVAGPVLRNVSGIGGVISRFATENTGAVSAIMAAVTTGNPLLALPFLPQIIDALFELIPMVIQAIIDIVPNLIQAIIDFFDFLNPWNVPSYDSLEEAVKASNEATADVRSGKYQYERGANSDWRPTDDGTKEMNFYGDLSFPNIENGEDAEEFVGNLKRMG